MKLTGYRNERDLQAQFYADAQRAGLRCYLEVKIAVSSSLYRSGYMRADVVVADSHDVAIALIEVKRPGKKAKPHWRQSKGYAEAGQRERVPVFMLNSFDAVQGLVARIKAL